MIMSGTHGNIAASRAFVNINPLPSSSSLSSPFSRVQTKSNLSSHSLRIIDRSKTSINLYISRYVQENEERDKKEREELELDSCHAFVTVNCLSLQIIDRSKTSINSYISRASIFFTLRTSGFAGLGAALNDTQRATTQPTLPNNKHQTSTGIDDEIATRVTI